MNVPRGTGSQPVPREAGNLTTYHRVRPIYPNAWELAALEAGAMTACRLVVSPDNSVLGSGSFDALDLESGRAVRNGGVSLRCRCAFPSGAVRVVPVLPGIGKEDLFWVRFGAGRRADSRLTLEVTKVDVARIQDMTDGQAGTYGVSELPNGVKLQPMHGRQPTARDWYQRAYPLAWRSNCWTWVLSFRVHRQNIDDLLGGRGRA